MTQPQPFIIIGVQKAGTTSVFHYLDAHPNIVMAIRGDNKAVGKGNEFHYFDRGLFMFKDRSYPRHRWYRSRHAFHIEQSGKQDVRTIGEKCPTYHVLPEAIRRIHKFNPMTKLIMILRDPVERFISWYAMGYQRGEVTPIRELLASLLDPSHVHGNIFDEAPYPLIRGHYYEQLLNIYQYFSDQQVLLLRFEGLTEQPQQTIRRITDFLALPPLQDDMVYPAYLRGTYHNFEVPQHVYDALSAYYAPHNELLTRTFGIPTEYWK